VGSSRFSAEHESKGAIVPGQFADLAILSAGYLSVPDYKQLESVLTIVGGNPVDGAEEFRELAGMVACGAFRRAGPNLRESPNPRTRAWFTHAPTIIAVQITQFSDGFGCFGGDL
jgi:hypothetical protein